MNCTTAQGKPCATQRTIMPKADEDLPLPAPVWTMISPFSPLFVGHHPVADGLLLRHLGGVADVFRPVPCRNPVRSWYSFGLTSRRGLAQMVCQRWFLSYDRRRGNAIGRIAGSGPKRSRPRDRDRRDPQLPLTAEVGKAGIRGEILLRKPGDLPAHRVEPADGVFRDGERAVARGTSPHRIFPPPR